jgi:thiamine kinase-like enzyme
MRVLEKWLHELFQAEYEIGLIHGDLHLKNIMKNKEGDLKLVDYDSVKKNGLRDLDVINLLVELESQRYGIDWRVQLLNFSNVLASENMYTPYLDLFSMEITPLLFFYYLDRIGNNARYYPDTNEQLLLDNKEAIDFFYGVAKELA